MYKHKNQSHSAIKIQIIYITLHYNQKKKSIFIIYHSIDLKTQQHNKYSNNKKNIKN